MSNQDTINILLFIINIGAGAIVKGMWDSLKELKSTDSQLSDKVNAIEVLVVGNYVKKDELERYMGAIFNKLDKIFDKLDEKQDK